GERDQGGVARVPDRDPVRTQRDRQAGMGDMPAGPSPREEPLRTAGLRVDERSTACRRRGGQPGEDASRAGWDRGGRAAQREREPRHHRLLLSTLSISRLPLLPATLVLRGLVLQLNSYRGALGEQVNHAVVVDLRDRQDNLR